MEEQDKQDLLEEEAEHRCAPSGKVVHKAILREADGELERTSAALFQPVVPGSNGLEDVAPRAMEHIVPDAVIPRYPASQAADPGVLAPCRHPP